MTTVLANVADIAPLPGTPELFVDSANLPTDRRQTAGGADIDGRGLGRCGLWVLGSLLSLALPALLLLKLLPHQLLAQQDA
ncbi:hypothetical protein EYF80_016304 [Liparis tanakae]|uniref:Uncharacterized protein n=1 Tax=Liparis tanakae TaxID=230148 RepID=A0A4Z2I841_9TELE|nr:hypothetical protein EYF80_016304 [Liparis tanakae]